MPLVPYRIQADFDSTTKRFTSITAIYDTNIVDEDGTNHATGALKMDKVLDGTLLNTLNATINQGSANSLYTALAEKKAAEEAAAKDQA